MDRLTLFKEQFSERQGIHFNSAGRTPLPQKTTEHLIRFISDNHLYGALRDADLFEILIRARKNMALFLDAEPSQVAFTPNTATALSQAALGFPLRKGDEVVVLDQEYSSNFYPWSVACERSGATLITVASGISGSEEFASGERLTEKVIASITPATKMVSVSWVQFQTGAVLDLEKIGKKAHSVGAYLIVDGIQGLGQIPFSFKNLPVDFVAGGAHKWMCATVGQGFLAVKKELLDLLSPTVVGCGTFNRFGTFADPQAEMEVSARKFEPGALAFGPLLALEVSTELFLATGMSVIHEEILRLSAIFRRGLEELGAGTLPGFDLVSPMNQLCGITSFKLPAAIEEKFTRMTKEANVAIIKRGEFIRVSIHAFCNEQEVDHVLLLLKMAMIQE